MDAPIEHHLTVPRTARYATLGGPAGDVDSAWFVLHGYGQLARYFIRSFESMGPSTLVVAPEALSRFYLGPLDSPPADQRMGASWMTREDRDAEIIDYVTYLDQVYAQVLSNAAPRRLVLLGFSQGAATASRWLARGRSRFDELILWGGGLAEDAIEAPDGVDRLRQVRLHLIVGERDEFVPPGRREQHLAVLRGAGLAPEVTVFPGGHEIDREVLSSLRPGPR